jgi:hypothetical protein
MIFSLDDITPQALTTLLSHAALLPSGQVTGIHFQPEETVPFGSAHPLYHLALKYANAENQPPERLFLKFSKSHKEYFFYTHIAPALGIPYLVKCYHAGYDAQTDQTCLLLEDLSATHFQTEWPLPPSEALCFQIVERLAEIHARGWQQPLLESDFRPALPAGRSWADRIALAIAQLPAFLNFLGDRLPPARRAVYERILSSSYPWDAPPGSSNLTLTHGDFHVWNVLYPRNPAGDIALDTLRFFDWNMWDIGRPSDDLAYLIALHWYPERRERLERKLLSYYFDHLCEYGITEYNWNTFWRDYRLSITRSLLIPVWQWARGTHPAVWWPHLERGLLAFEDLECSDIIAPL